MHSDRNGEGGAGPVDQPLTWDDEDVAAPERQGFLSLQEPDAHFPDACNQLVRCHFSCRSLRKLLPKQWQLTPMSMHGLTLNIAKSMQTNKVDGQTLTVDKYLDLLLSSST